MSKSTVHGEHGARNRGDRRPGDVSVHAVSRLPQDTEDHDVAFLASFADPKLIFEQLAVLHAMPRMGLALTLTLTLTLTHTLTLTLTRCSTRCLACGRATSV
eukprot:scaffold69790_cov58-Phaeocystis_antarctica.AAC.7